MQRKNVVIFFGKENGNKSNPLHFEGKEETYKKLLDKIYQNGGNVFVCRGIQNVRGNTIFHSGWKWNFKQKEFIFTKKNIFADAVLDRSATLTYPIDNRNNQNVLNPIGFKTLCKNKYETYKFLSEYCPITWTVNSKNEAEKTIHKHFANEKFVIIKPATGIKGIGIYKIKVNHSIADLPEIKEPYLIQAFLDSSVGIPGLAKGIHDLRIAFIKNEIVFSHVRQPVNKSFLANVAQGGTLNELEINQIPEIFLEVAQKIKQEINERYGDKLLFSTDLTNTKDGVKLIELSNDLGFPRDNSINADLFTEELAKLLLEIAK